jgi:hypothetical protein
VNRIMLDLETLGTAPGSVILSIGAVRFDDEKILDTFYVNISPESCVAAGLRMDVSTVMWWMGQSDEARKSLVTGEALVLHEALNEFGKWALRFGTSEAGKVDEIWGNGSDFDNVLLSHAYAAAGMPLPWSHRANRDYRTVRALVPGVVFEKPTIAHNALEDARAQAAHLIKMLNYLGLCPVVERAENAAVEHHPV